MGRIRSCGSLFFFHLCRFKTSQKLHCYSLIQIPIVQFRVLLEAQSKLIGYGVPVVVLRNIAKANRVKRYINGRYSSQYFQLTEVLHIALRYFIFYIDFWQYLDRLKGFYKMKPSIYLLRLRIKLKYIIF